ncbi:sensor histidine kinase [Streptomyces fulvoviolaceus]|uniref:sensor histidine kinase n=1 Tax=Streptomyces fulvoviolaceus TaxID=285535 RepID=UPI0004C74AE7|nr:HAMP domain-containing sensor histidine kinase [Streptomyces fulvoviolaceus]MCT9082378.1 HAMP domain-containing histidine kinase [Streptomyces fulvoviolaceus]
MIRGRPRSLRSRLVWGVTLLAAAAVLTAQTIGFLVLHSWLLNRVDQQLSEFVLPGRAFADPADPPVRPAPGSVTLPSDFRVTFYDASGQERGTLGRGTKPGPDLPRSTDEIGLTRGREAAVPAESGGGRWRALWKDGFDGTSYVVALPLDTVEGAMSKLLALNAVVLAVAVVGLITVGRWVVRLGLLPLTRMEHTAQDIPAGDLSLRLSDTDPRTETGRLGTVLNDMLDRLQQALRQREFSEDRLRRFVADAGHELRTPLTSIRGFAELALRHPDRPAAQRREADEQVAKNADRMNLLVDDLLLLAKLDREPEYRTGPVDLLSLAADAVSAAAVRDAGDHRVTLSPLDGTTDDSELDVVETVGDAHRLLQVVTNLLSNALVHTPPGTRVDVRVGTTRAGAAAGADRPGRTGAAPSLDEGTPVCVIEVADQGPGLPPEEAERIFERFYRVDPSRSRDHGGGGLGLAIASAIAQGHGGRLELDTAPGRGCAFRLVLPFADT